jgi:excisionase family DNA binding protein
MSSHSRTRWLKAAEVAELLRISNYTVVGLCRSGQIRASKVGDHTWRISEEALEEYLRACENEHAQTVPAATGGRKRKKRTA